jgi:hypothetical protein
MQVDDPDVGGGGPSEPHPGMLVDPSPPLAQASWAMDNEHTRRAALLFIDKGPLGYLILLRLALEPLRTMLQAHLRIAGTEAEWARQSAAAKAVSSADERIGFAKNLRICVAASRTLEGRFFEQLQLIMTEDEICDTLFPPRSAQCFFPDPRFQDPFEDGLRSD